MLSLLEREDFFPVVLYTDDLPTLLIGLVVEFLCEKYRPLFLVTLSPDRRRIRASRRRAVRVPTFAEPSAGKRVLEHLLVASGISKGNNWSTPDHQMDAFRLAEQTYHWSRSFGSLVRIGLPSFP